MRAPLALFLLVSGSSLLAKVGELQSDLHQLPRRDVTLIANPDSFPPSPAELAKIKVRVLKAEQAAAIARIAAIEARIRALNEERDSLIQREKQIGEALNSTRP